MFFDNEIRFFLNDRAIQHVVSPTESALDIIRSLGATGTKEVCSEGDCGACTVALGVPENGCWHYRAITSCIMPASQLHGRHVITVEGLGSPDMLHPIQQTLYDHHATQCGFCTPGFVMSIFCYLLNDPTPCLPRFRKALEGNLCRCTGYQHIIQAGDSLLKALLDGSLTQDALIPQYCASLWPLLEAVPENPQKIKRDERMLPVRCYHLCTSLDAALKQLTAQNDDTVICGASDLWVEANVARRFAGGYIDVQRIPELHKLAVEGDELHIGAAVTLEQLHKNPIIQKSFPLLHAAINEMASLQIRNVATLAGNIANASPVADGACALLALNARLELTSLSGTRTIALAEYYTGYKQTQLRSDELISTILLPMKPHSFQSFIKTAKRHNVDISAVASACCINHDEKGQCSSVTLALGGVKEYPALAHATMEFLSRMHIDEQLIDKAMCILQNEFTPISDVRGTAHYRSLLIANHLRKHLLRLINGGSDV